MILKSSKVSLQFVYAVLHIFGAPKDKVSWRPYFNRTQCLDGEKKKKQQQKNSSTPDLQKTKSVVVNKIGNVEVHVTDNKS